MSHKIQVEIPRRFRRWHPAPTATVEVQGNSVTLPSGEIFVVRRLEDGVYEVRKPEWDFKTGVITPQTIKGAVTYDYLVKMNLIRSAVLGVPYPAPIAYVPAHVHGLLHPGECLAKHSDLKIKKIKYTASDDDRCMECGRPFV